MRPFNNEMPPLPLVDPKDLHESGQVRLLRKDGHPTPEPVRLLRIVDMEREVVFVWLVESIIDGRKIRVYEDDLGALLSEMEAIAWAAL